MTNHDQFDELVDHALSEYRDAEPLAGLEDRVLKRLQSHTVERRNLHWVWGAIATCAAVVLVVVWIGVKIPTPPKEGGVGHPESTQPTQAREQVSPPVSSPESKEVARVTKTLIPPKEGGVGHPAVPLQNVASQFPTPVPLTDQERAFVNALGRQTQAAIAPPEHDEAIVIAEIEIQPLSNPKTQSGDNR